MNRCNSMETVVSELQCPICLELYTHPVILPCSHVLCRTPCAERLFTHSFVRCPVCRDNCYITGGVDSLPRVITLENIIQRYQEEQESVAVDDDNIEEGAVCSPPIPCQLCPGQSQPRRAKKSCVDCNASYCGICLELTHPDRAPFNEHTLIQPTRHPRPKEIKCTQHTEVASAYCITCRKLVCGVCMESGMHNNHEVLPLTEAQEKVRSLLGIRVNTLQNLQEELTEVIKGQEDVLRVFAENINERRCEINEQCNSLVAEIESKRSFFLSDLSYEEQTKAEAMQQTIDGFKKENTDVDSLINYAREVLQETDTATFLQLAGGITDRVLRDPGASSENSIAVVLPDGAQMKNKVVDFRKQKAVLRDMNYLAVAQTPFIDVNKCSRSASCVVLVIDSVPNEMDVVDGYDVYFCAENAQASASPNTQGSNQWVDKLQSFGLAQKCEHFRNTVDERRFVRPGNSIKHASVLLIENLNCGEKYFFCVRAINTAGESNTSDIVNCTTLAASEVQIPAPEIKTEHCRTFTSSIQIYCSSPMDTAAHVKTDYYLLYRENDGNKVWKSISLYGRLDHRVFGLEQNKQYEFIVLACAQGGQGQLSNKVILKTERSAV